MAVSTASLPAEVSVPVDAGSEGGLTVSAAGASVPVATEPAVASAEPEVVVPGVVVPDSEDAPAAPEPAAVVSADDAIAASPAKVAAPASAPAAASTAHQSTTAHIASNPLRLAGIDTTVFPTGGAGARRLHAKPGNRIKLH